jgi:DNA invertase Pin-like site-specific DNA recombinase
MNDANKVKPTHIQRAAFVYIRQSSPAQVEYNRESTARQYALVEKACQLGWAKEQVIVIDEDLGVSGSGFAERSGFARLTAEVALGHVGIVFGLEVSRVARNNADWYRLFDLCSITDTLVGDSDGLYHPALFNDRLVLGLKGIMAEAELHILRARLEGGIRNKAARGELRRGLPVGFVWGEQDGEVRFHPDESVVHTMRAVFAKFTELGSVRKVWLWFRSEGLSFPTRKHMKSEIRWVAPTYTAIHAVLTNPVYAGAYTYGKFHREQYVDDQGRLRKRTRLLPMAEWPVLLREHHLGYIDWATFQANQIRIDSNVHPEPHHAGGAVREGAALLQGLATCGKCGRRLHTHYTGRNAAPGYHCAGKDIVSGRGVYCLNVGGVQIDQAVVDAFLQALTPAALEATQLAIQQLEANHDAALSQWRLAVERAVYEAERAERRYRAVEPENRLVARGLETEWEKRLRDLAAAEAELERREKQRPHRLSEAEKKKDFLSRLRSASSLDGAYHHRSRSQGAFASPSGRSDCECGSARTPWASDSALARRYAHGMRSLLSAHEASWSSHQRRHYFSTPSSGRSLSGRGHRRHSQSSGTQNCNRGTLHGESGWQSASLSQYSTLRTAGRAAGWAGCADSSGSADLGHQHFHCSSLAE